MMLRLLVLEWLETWHEWKVPKSEFLGHCCLNFYSNFQEKQL